MEQPRTPPRRPAVKPLPGMGDNQYQGLYGGQQEFRIYQDAIEQLKNNEEQLPSLPTITLEIRKAVKDPNISHHQLSNIIAKDPSLTAILLKHASSSFYRTVEKPKNLQDVIGRIGLSAIDNLVLSHSLKSLFVMKDPALKKLYKQAWRRQTFKACTSYHLARLLRFPNPDNALVASLLSEVGTLAMLVALQNYDVPQEKTYRVLCRNYSKHLGAVLLAKWGLDNEFRSVLRQTGQWRISLHPQLQLIDIINLSLFHTIHHLNPVNDLIPLEDLAAYKKLAFPQNALAENGLLNSIEEDIDIIEIMINSFS